MAALTQDAGRVNYGSIIPPQTWMAAINQVFYQGSLVLVKADGFAYVGVAYATASAGFVVGVAAFALDTTADSTDGDSSVIVQPGIHGDFDNSAAADEIAEDDRGKVCYLVNDNTVALTDDTGARTAAGRIHNIADDGTSVVVQFEVIR
jgi:hypothetical protein